MKRTEEESTKLVNLMRMLQPHITAFSDNLLANGKDRDPVTCGGIVKGILDMNNFSFADAYEVVHKSDVVYVTIDDAFGELLLIVPGVTWRDAGANIDNVIIAKGILYAIRKDGTFINQVGNEGYFKRDDEPLRVLVATIAKLKESL